MKTQTTFALIASVLVCFLIGVGAALADSEAYLPLKIAPSEVITDATGADSTTATTKIASRAKATVDNPTAAVSVDFSGSAGDTVVVSCLLYQSTDYGTTLTFIGLSTATATAGAYVDAAGDNIAPLLFFDLSGATHYEIRHAAPSAGNVDLTWWSFGAATQ